VIDLPKDVEQLRVHLDRLVLTPIAEEAVQLGKAGAVEPAIALVDDGGAFPGVGIVEGQAAILGAGARTEDGRREQQRGRGKDSS